MCIPCTAFSRHDLNLLRYSTMVLSNFLASFCARFCLSFRRKNTIKPKKLLVVEACKSNCLTDEIRDRTCTEFRAGNINTVEDKVGSFCTDKIRRNSGWKNQYNEVCRRVSVGSFDRGSYCSATVSLPSGELYIQVSFSDC